jgi:hypothetical protein
MKPMRMKTATLHMDKETGQKTPGMVRSVRLMVLTSESVPRVKS